MQFSLILFENRDYTQINVHYTDSVHWIVGIKSISIVQIDYSDSDDDCFYYYKK